MKKKLKRTLAALSAVSMMVATAAVLPEEMSVNFSTSITAGAEEAVTLPTTLQFGNINIVENGAVINESGETWNYDASTNTINITADTELTNYDKCIYSDKDLNINVAEGVTLKSTVTGNYPDYGAIQCKENMFIGGTGTIKAISNASVRNYYGVYAGGKMQISGVTLNVEHNNKLADISYYAIKTGTGELIIENAVVTVPHTCQAGSKSNSLYPVKILGNSVVNINSGYYGLFGSEFTFSDQAHVKIKTSKSYVIGTLETDGNLVLANEHTTDYYWRSKSDAAFNYGTESCAGKKKYRDNYFEYIGAKHLKYTQNNDGETHKHCCIDECINTATVTESEACSGGTATCIDKAICAYCGEEYGELRNHDFNVNGLCSECGLQAAAKVELNGTTTCYENLPSAFAKENSGATITLLKDADVDENVMQIMINYNSKFILELNNKTLTFKGGNGYLNLINGELTVNGSGSIISEQNNGIRVQKDCKLTVNGGIIETKSSNHNGISVDAGGTVTINDGAHINSVSPFWGAVSASGEGAVVNISGGKFTGGITTSQGGMFKLSGGTFYSIGDGEVCVGKYGGGSVKDFLNSGYAYYRGEKAVTENLNENELTDAVTVKKCDHSEATYTPNADGKHDVYCPACDYEITENHTIKKVNANPATCIENGNIEYWICSDCDTLFSDSESKNVILLEDTVIPATGHSLTATAKKASTCTENGNIAYWYCDECGKYFSDENCTNEITLVDTVIPATGHTLTHIEQKDSTCTDNGNIEYWYCSECNKYFSDENCTTEITLSDTLITANGHNYVDGKCSECGVYENGIGEHLEGYSLSLNGNIGVNFYMGLDENVIADENAYMQFTLPNGEILKVKVSNAEQQKMNGNTYYVFSCEVAAKEMFDKITAQIITSDKMGEVYTYSVKDYIDYVVSNSTEFDEKTISLVNAMASYGNYARAYFNKEELFAMPEMDSITADTLAGFEKQTSGELPEGITYYGSSLLLESNTTIRHYFKAADGTDVSAYGFIEKDGYYCKDISDISAEKLGATYDVTVGDYTISYSPMSYVYTVLSSDSADESLKNLVKALVLYRQSAEEYQKKQG